MANIISIIESNNMLEFDGEQMPIVCGNSNYIFKFIFDEMWSACVHKTLVLVVNGKRIAVDFEGDEVKVPVLPNAEYANVSLLSAETESEQLSSTALRLELISTPLLDEMAEFDGVKGYLQTVIGAINNIESGNLSVQKAQVAENVSNPNLLINGDFRVNQRGNSVYTFSSVGGYFVDRWFSGSGQNWQINSDKTVTQTNTSAQANRWFCQWIEDYDKLLGKTVTITMKVKDAVKGKSYKLGLYDGTSVVGNTGTYQANGEQIVSATVTIPSTVSGSKLGVIIYPRNEAQENATVTICYVKMEIGETPTQFLSRAYAEELSLCQRYYQNIRISGNAITASSTSKLYPSVPIAVPFRAKGTLTAMIIPYIRNSGQNIQASSVVLNTLYDNCVVLEITRSQADLVASSLYATANGQAVIDAEIY